MKLLILLPGKIKPPALQPAETEYLQRLKKFKADAQVYRDARIATQPEAARRTEADRLLQLLKPEDYVVACDERGALLTTPKLTALLNDARQGGGICAGRRRLVLVIGGACGLSECIRQRADQVRALSGLVLAGGVARIVLLEALYRAFTVLEGHPYHNA
jgi:23S rRNA (pseudouridine1915-N3)-methyltransferase